MNFITECWEQWIKKQNEFKWESEMDERKGGSSHILSIKKKNPESWNSRLMKIFSILLMFPFEHGISKNSCQHLIKHFKYIFSKKRGIEWSQSSPIHKYPAFLDEFQENLWDNLQPYKSIISSRHKKKSPKWWRNLWNIQIKGQWMIDSHSEFFVKNELCVN